MWGTFLSEPLPIGGQVGRCPACCLIGRIPIRNRKNLCSRNDALARAHAALIRLSAGYSAVAGRLDTRYSPVRRSPPGTASSPRDAPRLACVKPVASVHPEPGSNSPLYNNVLTCLRSQSAKTAQKNRRHLLCSQNASEIPKFKAPSIKLKLTARILYPRTLPTKAAPVLLVLLLCLYEILSKNASPRTLPTKAAPVLLVLLLCLYEILSKNASSYFATGFSPKADAKVRTSKLPAKCFRNFFQRKPKVFTFLDINQAAECRRLMNRGEKCLNVSLYESKIELISDSESENFVLLCRPRLILI